MRCDGAQAQVGMAPLLQQVQAQAAGTGASLLAYTAMFRAAKFGAPSNRIHEFSEFHYILGNTEEFVPHPASQLGAGQDEQNPQLWAVKPCGQTLKRGCSLPQHGRLWV